MKLGTYTTLDCPTKNESKALGYLKTEFQAIKGNARMVLNPHDFGAYPSFEIDYPVDLLDIIDDDNEENQSLIDTWHDEANRIEKEYTKRFF